MRAHTVQAQVLRRFRMVRCAIPRTGFRRMTFAQRGARHRRSVAPHADPTHRPAKALALGWTEIKSAAPFVFHASTSCGSGAGRKRPLSPRINLFMTYLTESTFFSELLTLNDYQEKG